MTRPVSQKLVDPETRVTWMKKQGITHQIVGGWLDLFGYELPAGEGLRWSRLLNEHLLSGAKATTGLTALASVPLQDGQLAADVLNEALDAGFVGVMIGTQPKGMGGNLDGYQRARQIVHRVRLDFPYGRGISMLTWEIESDPEVCSGVVE